ncbi:MAG TPA: DUF2837 family protein [Clostridia bacterium]|nr:DUF2837 family protein [Clostridia bacterium]
MLDLNKFILVLILTVIIHTIDTLSYSVRIAGVRTNRLATAFSLFNIIVLASRTANLIQAPILGSIGDLAIKSNNIIAVTVSFRLIIFAATVGSIIGAVLIPTFVNLFIHLIIQLESKGSVTKMILSSFTLHNLKKLKGKIKNISYKQVKNHTKTDLPMSFLFLNILITSVHTIGVLSAIYAGVLIPQFRLTASQLSGIINGIATILLAVVVDPKSAVITDQVLQGKRKKSDVNSMVIYLVGGKILGTLLGQLLFIPASKIIVFFTQLIVMN